MELAALLFLSASLLSYTCGYTTSGSRSCRYNCGYDLGVCSCSSSCSRYGRCCRDYYDYCSYLETTADTTSWPRTTTDSGSRSCRYNCGYDLGVCSCSSSCSRYGRCCRDYYDYCSYMETTADTTSWPRTTTAGSRSCRYNCGYDLGVCSCSSSCSRYGRCCRDYYDYCSYLETTADTTSWPRTTTAGSRSCRYNCGYDLGVCSCSSSCSRYGRCCRDYYDYCSYLETTADTTSWPRTTTGGAPCGGSLNQPQGEFFSPNYPNFYPNNARCLWLIQGSELQLVQLNFTFIDLEACCDSVRVYDGPSERYPLLGVLGQTQTNHTNSFRSSSRYMTAMFSSDGSVTRRGFRAEWTLLPMPMCEGRCGWSFSRCSCETSCEFYGRCCHDYHEHCTNTTTPPAPGCGGRLHGSGEISSPNYPSNYPHNTLCEWHLSVPAGQTIFLSINDLDLERCCVCDHINVYDGPSTVSPLMAKVCYNHSSELNLLQSSSSSMTVQFRSDSSGAGRGFYAFFSSSLNEDTGRVDCSSGWLNVIVRKSYIESLGVSWHNLTLDEQRCRATAYNDYVSFHHPISSCGTGREVQDGHIIYTNNIRKPSRNQGEITRQLANPLLMVRCVMNQTGTVGTLYSVQENANAVISGTGEFDPTMAFYSSSNFSFPITQFPYQVELGQDVYLQVQLSRAESSLLLFLDTCVASPHDNFSSHIYDLIRNGCVRDNTVSIYTNGRASYARFRFKAFKYLNTHSTVFLRCDLVVCVSSDLSSRCRQGCRLREKRSLTSAHHAEVLTLGPITLKGDMKEEEKIKIKQEG